MLLKQLFTSATQFINSHLKAIKLNNLVAIVWILSCLALLGVTLIACWDMRENAAKQVVRYNLMNTTLKG